MKNSINVEIYARDLRMVRAATDVSRRYKIVRWPELKHDQAWFDITGGELPYLVGVSISWQKRPSCTCKDFEKRAMLVNGGFCKHIIAVLLKEDELRCQLLELFL